MDETNKPKTPEKPPREIKPVISRKPVKKENGFVTYIREFVNDDIPTIGRYMLDEVIVPTFINGIAQSLHTGISMFFRSGPTDYRGYYRGDTRGEWWNKEIKNDYSRYYRGDDRPYRPDNRPPWETPESDPYYRRGQKYSNAPLRDYLDYPIYNYAEAQNLLRTLREDISYYDKLSVADFYSRVDYKYPDAWEGNRSTLRDIGWFDLSTVRIETRSSRNGIVYYLTMPQAVDIR